MCKTAAEVPQSKHNEDRRRRADSWLERSEKAASDLRHAKSEHERAGLYSEQFIFLWIAFNAAYGYELIGENADDDDPPKEWEKFDEFLAKILRLDKERAIEDIIRRQYAGPIRILLENRYVYAKFWKRVRGVSAGANWSKCFEDSRRHSLRALQDGHIHDVLKVVFSRLYVLRNQVFHGGASFAKGWGAAQVRDGSRIMAALVPKILKIMRSDIDEDSESDWGKVAYPRINERWDG